MSPFYEIPWPVLLASVAALALLCLAAFVLGLVAGERIGREGRDR